MAWGTGPKLALMGAIREALERNLELKIERYNTEIQQEQVGLARSSLLPQIGLSTGIDLIDAQNSKNSSERAAAIAKYQFVLDSLVLERSIGRFHFLDSPEDKAHFISRLSEYMDTK